MPTTPRSLRDIGSYHAHVYYDDASRARAAELRERLAERFSVQLGRWRDAPTGPHPSAAFQVAFTPALFATLVPWLMLNRAGLTVLVHPNTDNPHEDHATHALWMGPPQPLKLDGLPRSLRAAGMPPDGVAANTTPHLADTI